MNLKATILSDDELFITDNRHYIGKRNRDLNIDYFTPLVGNEFLLNHIAMYYACRFYDLSASDWAGWCSDGERYRYEIIAHNKTARTYYIYNFGLGKYGRYNVLYYENANRFSYSLHANPPFKEISFANHTNIRPVITYDEADEVLSQAISEIKSLPNKTLNFVDVPEDYRENIGTIEYGYYPQEVIFKSSIDDFSETDCDGFTIYDSKAHTFRKAPIFIKDGDMYTILKIKGGYACFKIEPITWYIDLEQRRMISNTSIIGGIPVDWSINSSKKKFEESEIYRYLNEVFLKEMLQPGLVIDKSFTEKSNVEKSAVQFVKKM